MYSNPTIIHERSNIIPIINKNTKLSKITTKYADEYSLKQNFFDPTKSSPPNDFMVKLHMRMGKFSFFKNEN